MAVLKDNPDKAQKAVPFTKQLGFRRTLNQRVDEYFKNNNLTPRDVPEMYVKTAVLAVLYVLGYAAFLYVGHIGSPWALVVAVVWGVIITGLGFNTMHDAIHGAYSNNPKVNRVIGMAIELMGASGFVWKQKHNVWHHTYTNVAGLDEDLESNGAFRFSPQDEWKPQYRWQHIYAPFMYSLTSFSFVLRDLRVYFTGYSDKYHHYPPLPQKEKVIFWLGKLAFVVLNILIPMLVMPWWLALAGWVLAMMTISLCLAAIFQLAHVMEPCTFPEPGGDPLRFENEWAIHEVETTVDYAPQNKLLNWYCGGLNFQIEHHLYPQVCHVHYPEIAKIVKATCDEFGVKHFTYPTWRAALMSHLNVLKALGIKPSPAPVPVTSMPTVAK